MSGPAEVFSLAEYLADEMRERGWKTSDVAARMGNERGYDMDAFIFELVLAGGSDEATIDDETFAGMAQAFEVSEDLLRNIDTSWRQFPDRRSAYEAPDDMFNAGSFPATH